MTARDRTGSLASAVDLALGDPSMDDAPVSWSRSVALDQESRFPQAEFEAAVESGLQGGYVPTALGGTTDDLVDVMMGVRAVARRDLTAAVAHGKTFLGAVCAWDSAGEQVTLQVARLALEGGSISWGLTERGRGSDLIATSMRARRSDGAWELDGEKWMINNAARGDAITVLARTGEDPGPRSLSLFYVDKREIAENWRPLPKIATHGIRGADISGLALAGARLSDEHLIGEPGQGLEIVLRCLQVTRPLCAALSLGAADASVSAAIGFASRRRTQGHLLLGLPAARDQLADLAIDLAIADVLAVAGARHLQLAPAEAALVSPAVKYLVPHLVDGVMERATRFIGARAVLAQGEHGHVQKALRDNRVVSIFDGNAVVNLHSIVQQLPRALRRPSRGHSLSPARWVASRDATPLDFRNLRLVAGGGATVYSDLPLAADLAASRLDQVGRDLAGVLLRRSDSLAAQAARLSPARNPEPSAFRLAHEFAVLIAVAAVLARVSVSGAGDPWTDPGTSTAALRRLALMLDPVETPIPSGLLRRRSDAAFELVERWRHTAPGHGVSVIDSASVDEGGPV